MRSIIGAVVCGCGLLAGAGCQNFHYLQKTPDGGVVQFKAGEEQTVVEKLKKEHGDIEVVGVTDATASKAGSFDPTAPVKPSDRMVNTGNSFNSIFGQSDFGQMHLTYRKKMLAASGTAGLPGVPAEAGVKQAGFTSQSIYDRSGMGTRLPEPNMKAELPK